MKRKTERKLIKRAYKLCFRGKLNNVINCNENNIIDYIVFGYFSQSDNDTKLLDTYMKNKKFTKMYIEMAILDEAMLNYDFNDKGLREKLIKKVDRIIPYSIR